MAANLRYYEQLKPYLTEKAQAGLTCLKALGIEDEDLAHMVLETLLPEEELYDLESEESA